MDEQKEQQFKMKHKAFERIIDILDEYPPGTGINVAPLILLHSLSKISASQEAAKQAWEKMKEILDEQLPNLYAMFTKE